jgi:hypothetical protein
LGFDGLEALDDRAKQELAAGSKVLRITCGAVCEGLIDPSSHERVISTQSAVEVIKLVQDGSGQDRIWLSHGESP